MKRNVELLAPAGNYDSAFAAINAGADAVYLGGELFGARANAQNLSLDEIISIIKYAHIHGRKIYLTVNTLLKDNEIDKQLYNYLEPLYEVGLDAVIVQDIGVFLYVQKNFPELPIHCSTQMTIFGRYTAKELYNMGASRIVTPRELSLKEISLIHNEEGLEELEIESFVHGALCYCYSGQCFLSSYIGGRSGNRGRCAQPCRMEYSVLHEGKYINQKDEKYVLSPKDICTVNILPEIIEAGVSSLKIEGRMKKPEYIAGVVSIYRKYIDMYLKGEKYIVDPKDYQLLLDLFNRNGFNESYYKRHNGRDMISLKKPVFRKENKEFNEYLKKEYFASNLKRKISVKLLLKKDNPFTIITKVDDKIVETKGDIPQTALNKPIDKASLNKQINKIGNTNFEIEKIEYDVDDDLFLPIGAINNTRRQFIENVEESIVSQYYREQSTQHIGADTELSRNSDNQNNKIKITVSVCNLEQLNAVVKEKSVDTIYFDISYSSRRDAEKAINVCKNNNKRAYLAMPYVFREKDMAYFDREYKDIIDSFEGVLIRNIEQYYYIKQLGVEIETVFDYNVYIYNKYAKEYYNKIGIKVTCPLELNYNELKNRGCVGDEFIVYGYMPSMISAGCAKKTVEKCNNSDDKYVIKDRLGNSFVTNCVCRFCHNIMYNCKPLSLMKYKEDILTLNVSSVRIAFTNETSDEAKNVLKIFIDSWLNSKNTDEDCTRGHFRRGVM